MPTKATKTDEKRSEAKLKAAIDSMLPALKAASKAAHELDSPDEQQAEFDRMLQLGNIMASIGDLCGPRVKVLSDILYVLLELEHDEDELGKTVEETRERPLH